MTEAEAYKIAAACIRPLDGCGHVEEQQRAADKIAGALMLAWVDGGRVSTECAYRLRAACEVTLIKHALGAKHLREIRDALELNCKEGF